MVAPAVKFEGGITIGGGITAGVVPLPSPPTLMLNLDAATYTSGDWVDTVSGKAFVLYNGVSYSTDGGGSLAFVSSSNQYAQCATSLSSLNTWSAVAWHYYDGTQIGPDPCIITEVYTGGTINYALGSLNGNNPLLQAGWYSGGWSMPGYTLTPGNWYQIVGTYDGAHVRLYINTVLVSEMAATGAATSGESGIKLMNRWDVGATEYWGGKLGQVQVYDGAMQFGDIVTNWNANKARYGLGPSFTLTSADFTSVGTGYGCEGDTTGFGIGGNFNSTQACYIPSLTGPAITKLTNFWTTNGLSVGGASYLFDVTWALGSNTNTPNRTVMVVINEVNYLVTGTVDTNVAGWDIPGQNPLSSANMKAANGTFLFPATFTLIQPLITDQSDWC